MTTLHPAMAAYIDGLKTSIDRLSLDYDGNDFAKGYRTALDDIANYLDEVEAGLIEERVVDEYNHQIKKAEARAK